MRIIFPLGLCCLLLAAPAAGASQARDYEGVRAAVSALNDPAARASLFLPNAGGSSQLQARLAAPPFREPPSNGHWEVVISHEPMGEAQVVPVPGPVLVAPPPAVQTPRIVVRDIRFSAPNRAVVDATIQHPGQGSGGDTELRLVMVRGSGTWRVASAHFGKP